MNRRKNTIESTKIKKTAAKKRARPVPVVVIDSSAPPASPHVLDLKIEQPKNPLLSIDPIRCTPIQKTNTGFKPKVNEFRDKAGAIASVSKVADVYEIKNKKKVFEKLTNTSDLKSNFQTTNLEPTKETSEVLSTKPRKVLKKSPRLELNKYLPVLRIKAAQAYYKNFLTTCRSIKILRREVAIGFTVMSLVFTMPIYALTNYSDLAEKKDNIMQNGYDALDSIKSSKSLFESGNTNQGASLLVNALTSFEQAKQEVDSLGQVSKTLLSIVPVIGSKVKAGEHLLNAGEALTFTATKIALAKQDAPESFATDKLIYWHQIIEETYPRIIFAQEELDKVDSTKLPQEIQPQIEQLKKIVDALAQDTSLFIKTTPTILDALGAKSKKRYLLVFQNSAELRATGGFIGSFGLIDIDRGEITNLEIPAGGSYDLQGQLTDHVTPPLPLYLVNNRWEFQDANWYPDFPTSAKNLMWFYEHSGGPTVDGVIAITDDFVKMLLQAVGPISTEDDTITSDNFSQITSEKIQALRNANSKSPKAIIGELAPLLLEQLKQPDIKKSTALANTIIQAIPQGNILFYSKDKILADTLKKFDLDGALKKSSQDYLHVNISNIGGEKSDTDLEGRIEHQAWIEPDGSIIDTVTIIRTHIGNTSESSNISYLRIYAPEGSELMDAAGFTFPAESDFHAPLEYTQPQEQHLAIEKEVGYHDKTGTKITQEFDKTVFGNWMITRPHQTSVVRMTYRLPFKAFDAKNIFHPLRRGLNMIDLFKPAWRYSVLHEHQPALKNMKLQSHVVVPPQWRTIFTTPKPQAQRFSDGVKFEKTFDSDAFFGITTEQK